MSTIAIISVSLLIGVVLGLLLMRLTYRLTEPYKRGTLVTISTFGDATLAKYLRKTAIGYHKVEIQPGDALHWDGRIVTVKTKDMAKTQLQQEN